MKYIYNVSEIFIFFLSNSLRITFTNMIQIQGSRAIEINGNLNNFDDPWKPSKAILCSSAKVDLSGLVGSDDKNLLETFAFYRKLSIYINWQFVWECRDCWQWIAALWVVMDALLVLLSKFRSIFCHWVGL